MEMARSLDRPAFRSGKGLAVRGRERRGRRGRGQEGLGRDMAELAILAGGSAVMGVGGTQEAQQAEQIQDEGPENDPVPDSGIEAIGCHGQINIVPGSQINL